MCQLMSVFFFFQAEDGIRDLTVTGVQTCALPISFARSPRANARHGQPSSAVSTPQHGITLQSGCCGPSSTRSEEHTSELQSQSNLVCRLLLEKKKDNNEY